MSEPALQIRAFSETFLTFKTRGRRGRLRFLQLPVRLDDPDYAALASRKDGAATLGVWLGLLELAGTSDRRDGIFRTENGRPLGQVEIAHLIRMQPKLVSTAIARLREIGWLVPHVAETPSHDSASPSPIGEWRGVEGR